MRSVKLFSLLIALFCLISVNSCKKDKQSNAPAIPPSSTLDIDFSAFTSMNSQVSQQSMNYLPTNFQIAVSVVAFWSGAAAVYTEVPVLAFKAVIAAGNPTYDGQNDQWIWSKQFTKPTQESCLAELTGKVTGDSIKWTMNITPVGGETFKWFDGVSHTDHGSWTLYSQAGAALLINWVKTSDQVGYLKYTNVIAEDANNGAYIKFASTSSTDKYFEIKIVNDPNNAENDNVVYTIDWNTSTKEGDINSVNGKYCWDSTFANVDCSGVVAK